MRTVETLRPVHTIEGRCHCGNLGFELETDCPPEAITIRACQCRFCRMHGAATARHPDWSARISARDPGRVIRYRFASGTTDFVLCGICGVYLGAVLTREDRQYATLNMRLSHLDCSRAEPVVYGDEPAAERVARRAERFTPVLACPF